MAISAPTNLNICWEPDNTGISGGMIEVPEGGSVTRYFFFVSPYTKFDIRKRVRLRPSTSEVPGEWSEWTTETKTIATASPGAYSNARIDTSGITYSSTQINPTGDDYGEVQCQVRAISNTTYSDWSAVATFKVVYKPIVNLAISLLSSGLFSVSWTTSWLRPGNKTGINRINLTNVSGTRVFSGWRYFSDKNGSDYLTLSQSDFSQSVATGTTYYITGSFTTSDGCQVNFNQAKQLPYALCNTPVISLTPDDEAATVEITVTDAGDKSAPISKVTISMASVDRLLDIITVTPGETVIHHVPPLDVPITYIAVAETGTGAYSAVQSAPVTVDSLGLLRWNFGENASESLSMEMNTDWKSSYDPEVATKKLANRKRASHAYGTGGENDLSAAGDIWCEGGKKQIHAFRESNPVIFRAPDGERYLVSLTNVSDGNASGDRRLVTDVSISMSESDGTYPSTMEVA